MFPFPYHQQQQQQQVSFQQQQLTGYDMGAYYQQQYHHQQQQQQQQQQQPPLQQQQLPTNPAPSPITVDQQAQAEEKLTLKQALDDLTSRFLLTVPPEELSSFERIMFAIEQAHWFYLDFYREANASLPKFGLKEFTLQNTGSCTSTANLPELTQYLSDFEVIFDNFIQYKIRVPVYGAIILNSKLDKCLMVKGWNKSCGWGFPKGKVNKDEDPFDCAVREVIEETGFDITPYADKTQYIELTIQDQINRLYLVRNVPEDTVFLPQTRKEISKIKWHDIQDLPTKGDFRKPDTKTTTKGYYLVLPFIPKLRSWLKKKAAPVSILPKSGSVATFQPQHPHQQQISVQQLFMSNLPSIPPSTELMSSAPLQRADYHLAHHAPGFLPHSASTPDFSHLQPHAQRREASTEHSPSQALKTLLKVGASDSGKTNGAPALDAHEHSQALLNIIKGFQSHQHAAASEASSLRPSISPAPSFHSGQPNLLSRIAVHPTGDMAANTTAMLQRDAHGILHFSSSALQSFRFDADSIMACFP